MRERIYEVAYKYALKNAVEHGGKASEKAVFSKVFLEIPDAKKHLDIVKSAVLEAVDRVNSLSIDEQRTELSKYAFVKVERGRERKVLKDVVTRFAVEPGGRIHLGNLRAAFANYFFARENNGKFILRVDDTNPEKVRSVYYDFLEEDLRDCGIDWDEKMYQSDRFAFYLDLLRRLVASGRAYFTFESPESIRKMRREGRAPPEREKPVEYHLDVFDGVLEGRYAEGEVVLLLASNPSHRNPVLREPALARIITSVPHPRTGWKYSFYPTYNFASAVDDSAVSHVLRGKDHENNARLQELIREYLGLPNPENITFGRIKVEEGKIPLGKRHIREAILGGEIEGWGDIKISTVRSLLNRGVRREALFEIFKEIGAKKTDINLPMEKIYSVNRKLLDAVPRYFFVPDPVPVEVNAPAVDVEIPYHPTMELGTRRYVFPRGTHKLYISKEDCFGELRLLHLYNIKISGGRAVYSGTEVRGRKVQWVCDYSVPAEVLLPDGTVLKGLIEGYAEFLRPGDIVRLERVCFARVRSNEGEKITFYWTHS